MPGLRGTFHPVFSIRVDRNPASRHVAGTVARWRERDASTSDELLLTHVIPDTDDGRAERWFAMMFAILMILWIVGGIAIELQRGAH